MKPGIRVKEKLIYFYVTILLTVENEYSGPLWLDGISAPFHLNISFSFRC